MPIRSGRQIRSGRFKGDASGTGILIIAGIDGLFRIYNAGEATTDTFDVHPKELGGVVVTLNSECSIDVEVTDQCRIVSANPAKGMYDFLGASHRIRSGRFKGSAAAATKIVQGTTKRAYRILNSGDEIITVKTLKTTVELKSRMCIDLATGGDITVEGTDIECIYELLADDQEVHSGRFNIKDVADAYPHKIIDLTDGGKDSWYRIYNSGVRPFKVFREGSPTQAVPVLKGRSFDFRADESAAIMVEAGNTAHKIAGIYEYLG